KCLSYVINGTAVCFSVFHYFIFLSESCLCVNSCHSEKCAEPHPEDCTGTTADKGCSSTCKVTCTNLSRYGSCQSLERTHLAVFTFCAFKLDVAEYELKSFTEFSYLDKSEPESIVDT